MAERPPYRPAGWLPNRHLMTVYAALVRFPERLPVWRERLDLPDGDFVDLDRLDGRLDGMAEDRPLILVLHGLEGSSRAGYVRGVLAAAAARGYAGAALNFRGCSGEPNRLARFYHSGDTADLAQVVEHLRRERPGRPLGIVGFSLGGNVLAKWFADLGRDLPAEVRGGVCVSPPLDLARCAAALDGPGFFSALYRARFLRSLKRKALAKASRFPNAILARRVHAAHTFAAFDGSVTAPLHGFPDADTYWRVCSAGPLLDRVHRPLHILSATDDPFVPPHEVRGSPAVSVEVTARGGHVAFLQGGPFRPVRYAEHRAVQVLSVLMEEPR